MSDRDGAPDQPDVRDHPGGRDRAGVRDQPGGRDQDGDRTGGREQTSVSERESVHEDQETRPVSHVATTGRGPRGWLRRTVRQALLGALLVGAVLVGGTAFRVWQVARVDDRRPVDVVIVLGAAQYDGGPSPIFAARLRHAQSLYEERMASRIVTVGGNRAGDSFTEGEAGQRYLVDRGVPSSAVLAVGEGSDTLESLRAVAQMGESRGWKTALVVSDPWHSLRARTMCRDAGLPAWSSPTRSGPVVQARATQVRYIVRETGALLYYRLTHASVETESSGVG